MNKILVLKVLLGLFVVLFILNISMINFNDLSFKANVGSYLGAASNILFVVAMLVSIRAMKKKEQ